MSLPYPSMTFVPLDILTAEEMNQLVTNIESLASGTGLNAGAVGTSAIANSAVTSAKIGWTTLGTDYFSQITFVSSVTSKRGYWVKYPNGLCVFSLTVTVNVQVPASGYSICDALPSAIAPTINNQQFFPGWIWWASTNSSKPCSLRCRDTDRRLLLYPVAAIPADNVWQFFGSYFTDKG